MGTRNGVTLSSGHWVEFCTAVVDDRRDHVDIPLRDLAPIVIEALRHDLLSEAEISVLAAAAEESMLRRQLQRGHAA